MANQAIILKDDGTWRLGSIQKKKQTTKKSTATKTVAKKQTVKKSTAKKPVARKSGAKKSTARKK